MLKKDHLDAIEAMTALFNKQTAPNPVEKSPQPDSSAPTAETAGPTENAEPEDASEENELEELLAEVDGATEPAEVLLEEPQQPLPPPPKALRADRSNNDIENDIAWAAGNLRNNGDQPYADLANVLRIFNRHPDFQGRFGYDRSMAKVHDKGTIMLAWQVDELCAIIQERFIPAIPPEMVSRALLIFANRHAKPADAS